MPITLAQLRAFVAVADAGGFGGAADGLSTTQSAVSHAVAALEEDLGVPLFVRRPRVRLTAAGSSVLSHARAAVGAADAVQLAAVEATQSTSGRVRLAVPPTAAFGLLPEIMERWRAAYPGISVQVFEGDDDELGAWLDAGLVDAAILINPETAPVDAVEVGRDEYEATLPIDHPLAGQRIIDPADLLDDPVLTASSGCGPYVTRIMRRADPSFQPASVVRDIGALLGMVAAGVGVTIFPSIGRGMLPPSLVSVPLTSTETRSLVFSGPASGEWTPQVSALAAVLCRLAA